MIHPDDKEYLEKERGKVHDTYDHSKSMTDLLVSQAYRKGYERARKELIGMKLEVVR